LPAGEEAEREQSTCRESRSRARIPSHHDDAIVPRARGRGKRNGAGWLRKRTSPTTSRALAEGAGPRRSWPMYGAAAYDPLMSLFVRKNERREVRRAVRLACTVVRERDFCLVSERALDVSPA